jgi:hypothetical protein
VRDAKQAYGRCGAVGGEGREERGQVQGARVRGRRIGRQTVGCLVSVEDGWKDADEPRLLTAPRTRFADTNTDDLTIYWAMTIMRFASHARGT